MKKRISISLIFMFLLGSILTFLIVVNFAYNRNVENINRDLETYSKNISNIINNIDEDQLDELFLKLNNSDKIGYFYKEKSGEITHTNNYLGNIDKIKELMSNEDFLKNEPLIHFDRETRDNIVFDIQELDNGDFLILAKPGDNFFSTFKSMIPIYLVTILIGIFIAFYLSERSIDDFVSSIEDQTRHSSYEDIQFTSPYKEIYPLLRVIQDQKNDINNHLTDIKNKTETIETIISNMKEGMILLDDNLNILLTNKAAIDLGDINYEDVDFKGKNLTNLIRDEDLKRALKSAAEGNSNVVNLEVKINDKYISAFINHVKNRGLDIGLVLILLDDTEKKELELKRREFSANVSHELKTPLTSINGYAEMISSGIAKSEDTKRFAEIIHQEGIHLLKVIDDIIKISKLDENNNRLDVEEVDLSSIIYEILNRLESKISLYNIDIKFSPKNIKYKTNSGLTSELLLNLIDNGLKYNRPNGSVEIILDEDINNVKIQIIDTGIGISPENKERIFERFFTVDKSHNKKDSTGLGLSIVKHIIKLLNGEIKLESQLGEGSKFTVILPK